MRLKIGYLGFLFAICTSVVFAHGDSGNTTKRKSPVIGNEREQQIEDTTNENEINGELIQKIFIDGFELKLKIVDVEDSVPDGGSHNLLVSIKHNDSVQHDLSVTSNVVYPSGVEKSKSMMELGDWYLAGFDLGDENEYRITISFESIDGVNHSSEINYP